MESCLLEELSLAPGVGMDICMHAQYYDVTPFYAYPETWTENGVVVENYLNSGYRAFIRENKTLGEAEPIWINEMGFAATPG